MVTVELMGGPGDGQLVTIQVEDAFKGIVRLKEVVCVDDVDDPPLYETRYHFYYFRKDAEGNPVQFSDGNYPVDYIPGMTRRD